MRLEVAALAVLVLIVAALRHLCKTLERGLRKVESAALMLGRQCVYRYEGHEYLAQCIIVTHTGRICIRGFTCRTRHKVWLGPEEVTERVTWL